MGVLFFLLTVVCLVCLTIGLFKPDKVIKWGLEENKTRKSVLKYYGIGMLVFFILFIANIDNSYVEKNSIAKSVTTIEQSEKKDKKAAEDVDEKIADLCSANVITLDNLEEVRTARDAYDKLTIMQKSLITNFTILSTAESKIYDLQIAETEKAIAAVKEAEAKVEQVEQIQEEATTLGPQIQEVPQIQNNEYTVYITDTGSKYHRSDCRYLRQSQTSIIKSTAISQGYSPCSICNP